MKKIDNFYIFYPICCIFIFLRLEIFYGSDIAAPFTDDFYYYLTTAKNFINLGSTTFDKISLTNGFQPLWFLVITSVYFFFQNNIIFNIIIIFLIFILTFFSYLNFKKYLIGNNFSLSESMFVSSLACYLSLFFSKNGMEISLAIFFFSWSLLYYNRNLLIFCLLSFATFLSRLEFLIFYFIFLSDELLIKKKIFDFKNTLSENKVINELKKNDIHLICLAGFMKILSKSFIKNFKGKILNIHPSLLPKYKGLNTHERAINNKDKYSGCTVHFVNSKLDSGEIINQKKVRIKKLDNPKTLAKRILIQEHKLYPAAIIKALSL